LSFAAIIWFNFSAKLSFIGRAGHRAKEILSSIDLQYFRRRRSNVFLDVTTGIRDFDLIVNLLKYYVLTLCFLASVFIIFTAFELWKFAGTIDGGIVLLMKYLFYLVPFIYIQLAPSAAMVATLTTYVLKSRQNEIITWTSAGQSVYRLLFPCLLLMILLGAVNLLIQERVAPAANQRQDALRSQIRSRGLLPNKAGKLWVANDKRIYSFQMDAANTVGNIDNPVASDNAKRYATLCPTVCAVRDLTVYEFADSGNLQTLYRSKFATWEGNSIKFDGVVEKTILSEGVISTTEQVGGEVSETSNPFAELRKKPSHLDISETKTQLKNTEAEIEKRSFAIALEKKYTTLILPFVIALFTAPFALSLSRKGKVITVGYAVGLWLLFMGLTSTFEQFGSNGSLSPSVAVWAPLAVFSMLGIYLLSRVRT
jgi:lipopolysaccharide export system permease protein